MRSAFASIFGNQIEVIEQFRASDPVFNEMCEEFEDLAVSLEKRFGTVDATTADLIASFDEVRREIEQRVQSQLTRRTL